MPFRTLVFLLVVLPLSTPAFTDSLNLRDRDLESQVSRALLFQWSKMVGRAQLTQMLPHMQLNEVNTSPSRVSAELGATQRLTEDQIGRIAREFRDLVPPRIRFIYLCFYSKDDEDRAIWATAYAFNSKFEILVASANPNDPEPKPYWKHSHRHCRPSR